MNPWPSRVAMFGVPLLAVAAVVWALSVPAAAPADYTFTNGGEVKTLDPARVTGSIEGRILRGLFEGLVNLDPEDLRPVPGVAERWEISADQLTYTFYLRADAVWSDGAPLSAADFVYSFRRFLHPETPNEYAYEMWYVTGAEDFTKQRLAVGQPVEIERFDRPLGALPFAAGEMVRGKLLEVSDDSPPLVAVDIGGERLRFRQTAAPQSPEDGVEAVRWIVPDFDATVGIWAIDDRTLQIRLHRPTPYFLELMSFFPMSPVQQRCVETHGFPYWTKPENIVTNGPFLLGERRIRDRIRLLKNPRYWDRENVHLNVVDALPISSDTTALNLYETGQADSILTVPQTIVPELLGRGDFNPAPYLATYYFRLNVTKPPLDNPLVRRALGLAIDKQEIVDRVTRAGQQPAHSLTPAGIEAYMGYAPPACAPYDPPAARRLLAEAGYEGGRGFPKLEILYNSSESHQAIAELIQSQLRRNLGIDVRLQNVEWSDYLARQSRLDYEISRAGWIGDYVDPNTFIDMFVTDGGNNQTGWSHADYDRLVEEAQAEPDAARRLELFRQAEQILLDEMPVIPIYYHVTTSLVRPYVKGYYPNVQDVHPFQGMSVDQAEKDRLLSELGVR